MMLLPCCRLFMTGASLSCRTRLPGQTNDDLAIFSEDDLANFSEDQNLFLNCPQPIPYVYPQKFEKLTHKN